MGISAPAFALGEDSRQGVEGARPAAPGPTILARNAAGVRYAPGRILVGFHEGASSARVDRAVDRTGARVRRSIPGLDARVLEVPDSEVDEAIQSLEASATVEYVEREVLLQVSDTVPNDALWKGQWGPRLIGGPKAWDVTRGAAGTVIAVVDTGVDYGHPDLQGMFVPGYDFINNDANPRDDHGHGTAAAGVVAARTHNLTGQAGVCWRCSLMPVKVLDASGWGTSAAVAAGIVWAANHGARVISLSLGGAGTTQALADAVAYAAGKGVLLVAAAGNSGTTTQFYPAAYPEVVSVAGTTSSDKLYSWSNRGRWVQLAGPGCNTAPQAGGGYVNFCGTSSSTPLVAGIAGLALSRQPSLARSTLAQALRSSAVPLASGVRYGRAHALRTLLALGLAPPLNTRRPRIRGTPRAGELLEAGKGRWQGRPTSFRYRWRRCNQAGKKCANIAGARERTYRVRRADIGSTLRVRVRARNRSGATRAQSKPTEVVTRALRRARTTAQAAPASEGFQTTTAAAAASSPETGEETEPAPCPDCPPPPPPPPTLTETLVSEVNSAVTEVADTATDILTIPASLP